MKAALVILLVLLVACTDTAVPKNSSVEKVSNSQISNDLAFLLGEFLAITNAEFIAEKDSGDIEIDELQLFKKLESIYIAAFEPDIEGEPLTDTQLKTLMFFTLYAKNRNSAAFNEYLATDLLPVFRTNPQRFAKLLAQQPVLIPTVCDRLNAFFSSEEVEESVRAVFIKEDVPKLRAEMNNRQMAICLQNLS